MKAAVYGRKQCGRSRVDVARVLRILRKIYRAVVVVVVKPC